MQVTPNTNQVAERMVQWKNCGRGRLFAECSNKVLIAESEDTVKILSPCAHLTVFFYAPVFQQKRCRKLPSSTLSFNL